MGLCTIKTSADFRLVRGGSRIATQGFVMETRARADASLATCSGARFGFVVTRKIGNAVVRNRIRRRLKEAIRTCGSDLALSGHDYVVVARSSAADQGFGELKQQIVDAMTRLRRQSTSPSVPSAKRRVPSR